MDGISRQELQVFFGRQYANENRILQIHLNKIAKQPNVLQLPFAVFIHANSSIFRYAVFKQQCAKV